MYKLELNGTVLKISGEVLTFTSKEKAEHFCLVNGYEKIDDDIYQSILGKKIYKILIKKV